MSNLLQLETSVSEPLPFFVLLFLLLLYLSCIFSWRQNLIAKHWLVWTVHASSTQFSNGIDWFENAGLKNVILNALSIFRLMFQQWLQHYIYFCRERIVHVKYLPCHDTNTFRENFLDMRLKYCRLSGKGNGFQEIEKGFSACGLEL